MTPALEVELQDLRDAPAMERAARCAQFFEQVYLPAFPDPAVRETPDVWLALLARNPPPPAPLLHVIVATGVAASGEIAGGFLCEYYRRSNAALATYLVVRPEHRRHGIAGRLLRHGLALLRGDAASAGVAPPVLYAEAEDPARVAPDDHEAPARLHRLAHLGFRGCALPYVQPGLAPGSPRVAYLMLLAHGDGAAGIRVPSDRLRAFLTEFYEAQRCENPSEDPDFRRMSDWLDAHDPVCFAPLERSTAAR